MDDERSYQRRKTSHPGQEVPTVPAGPPVVHPPGASSGGSPTFVSDPSVSDLPPAAEPRAFGRFELLEELGSGGMGTVYKARQLDLERLVALKTLHGSLGASRTLIERFMREARAAAKLDHPGLVRVFEVGCLEGTYFFTMEYVRGESLLAKLARDPFPLAERIRWVRDAALAVHHAHTQGFVHRDIKPQNILVDVEGRVKVTDFGLVREVADERGLTLTGQVIGTPCYMPPEQARGEWDRIGPASDVYALGATLYELAAGRPPVTGADTFEVLAMVKRGEVTPLRSADGKLPRDLDTVCMKAMDPTPSRRYASAADLAEDLDRLLRLEPVHARPLSRSERVMRWARRRWRAVALAGGVAVLVLGVAGVLWKAQQRASEAARARTEAYRLCSLASDPSRVLAEGGVDWARDRLVEAVRLHPDCKEAHLRLAILREWIGDTDDAIATYERVLAIDPLLARARFRLIVVRALQAGTLETAQGQAEARAPIDRQIDELARDCPGDPYARLAEGVRGAILAWGPEATARQIEADIRRLESLLEADTTVRDLPEGRFLLAGMLGAFYHPVASNAFSAAIPFHDPDRALRLLDELVAQDPLDLLSQMNLGVLRFELGDLRGAEERFRSLERRAPNWPEPHYFLGRVLLAQTRFDEAVVPLEVSRALGRDPQTWAVVALARWLAGDAQGALGLCEETLGRETGTMTARDAGRLRVLILHGLGRREEAQEELLRLRANGGEALDSLGDVQAQLAKPELRLAVEVVRKQLQDFPDVMYLTPKDKHAIRAMMATVARLPQFRKLQKLVPSSARVRLDLVKTLEHSAWIERERPEIWSAMGWYLQECGVKTDIHDIALITHFIWKLQHDDDLRRRSVLFTLAEHHWQAGLFYREGEPKEAEEVLEAALERYGPDAKTLYGLATMRALRGDAHGCAVALRRAREFGWRGVGFVAEDSDFARVVASPEVQAVLAEPRLRARGGARRPDSRLRTCGRSARRVRSAPPARESAMLRAATFLLFVCPLLAQDAQPLPDGASLEIVVQEVQGEVDVRPSAKEKWATVTKGMKLAPGAKFCTGVGSAVAIAFGTNSVALVAECSVCEIRAFEMRGEELVANIHLEPGTAQVHVKQLAQLHTDFQVSTPRLTCSVRGSRGRFRSECDEIPDFVGNDEGHVDAQGRSLAPTETTNSDGDTHQDIETKENVADTTPDGATENEQDPNLIANNAGSIDLNTSDATLNTDPSPSGGDNSTNEEAPPPDEGSTQPPDTGPHTMDLVLMSLNGQDVTVHAPDDIPGENDGETGIEGAERLAFLDLFLTEGIDAFLQAFLSAIHNDFHNGMSGVEISDPARFTARHLEFHDDLPEAGFDALTTYLQAAAVQAAADPVDARDATLILASLFHTDFHVINSELPESSFVTLHQEFHTDEMDPILLAILETDFEGALAMWGSLVHRTWHDNTGCDDFLDGQDVCFGPHQHFEGRLIEAGNNLRALTETLGIQTAEEELMVHTYLNHADIRGHSRDQDDIFEFQLRHDHMDFEHNGLGITGLAAGVKHFDAADVHHEFHEDPNGLQQTDQALFDQRHAEFHTSDSVFGHDGYIAFWSQVAEQARNQTVDRGALGHALIAGIDIDFLRANYSLPPGNSPGQYDFQRAQFLQNVIDPMHAMSDADQFPQLIHTYRDFLHDRWHTNTGVPTNVLFGQTGFEAHQHLHQSLDDFHTQAHSATGIPD